MADTLSRLDRLRADDSHPRDGWEYPMLHQVEQFNWATIGAVVRLEDGSLRLVKWQLADILGYAELNEEL